MNSTRHPLRRWMQAGLVLGALVCGGCSMQRTLTIDTQPTGAHIWVNGRLQDRRTPVDIPFTHYGRFDVRVEKEGYHSVASDLDIPTEIDGYPIIDLPLEMLTPERRFRRVITMQPIKATPTEADVQAALRRAEAFRSRTEREVSEPDTPGRSAPGKILP